MTQKIVVEKVTDLNPVARSITFRRPDGFDFLPGQHVVFYLDGKGARPFTMVSSPTDTRRLEFGIKRVGGFTARMHKLKPGDRAEIIGPLGTFYFEDEIRDDIILIAGGSGITPFISMLRYIEDRRLKNRATVIYSNKTSDEIMFMGELELLRQKGIIANLVYTVTRDDPEWYGTRGHVSRGMIENSVTDIKNKIYFICGPPEFEKAVYNTLASMHIRRKRIKTAAWG